jgi:cyclic lactone autoinducer peptide
MKKIVSKKFGMFMGAALSIIALTVVNTASWVLLHSEELPEELQ